MEKELERIEQYLKRLNKNVVFVDSLERFAPTTLPRGTESFSKQMAKPKPLVF